MMKAKRTIGCTKPRNESLRYNHLTGISCKAAVLCGLLGLTTAFPARALDWDSLTYVDLTGDAATAAKWAEWGSGGTRWSDGANPTAAKHYRVPDGYSVSANNSGTMTFPGGSFTLLGTMNLSYKQITFTNPIRLMPGSKVSSSSYGTLRSDDVTVSTSAAQPFTYILNRSDAYQTVGLALTCHGAADARMVFSYSQNKKRQVLNLKSSDFSDYLGTLDFTANAESGSTFATNLFTTGVFPGTVSFGAKTVLNLSSETDEMTVGTLSFASDSALSLARKSATEVAMITVTNLLTVGEGTALAVDPVSLVADPAGVAKVFHLTGAAAQNLPDLSNFVLTASDTSATGWTQELRYEADGESGQYVVIGLSGVNVLTNDLKNTVDVFSSEANEYWSLGYTPADERAAGSVCVMNGYGTWVPVTSSVSTDTELKASVLAIREYLAMGGHELTMPGDILLYANAGIYATRSSKGTSDSRVVGGTVTAMDGTADAPVDFSVSMGNSLTIGSELSGSGYVRAATREETSKPYGTIEFTGTNTNFTGRLELASPSESSDTTKGYRLRFYLSDARNLGGAMPEDAFDGIKVHQDSIVIGRNALTFDEKTRGILIGDRARFVMTSQESNVLTFNVPVTFGGEMVFGNDYPDAASAKTGSGYGTLVMGGVARFYNASTQACQDSPVADADYRLKMATGRLQVTSTNALDGVSVTFAEGSEGLELDLNASDDIKKYGLYDVKTDTPLSSTCTDGKIPVRFENLPGNAATLGICTVKDVATANNVKSLLSLVRPRGYKVTLLEPEENKDGTATIRAQVSSCGFVLIFR